MAAMSLAWVRLPRCYPCGADHTLRWALANTIAKGRLRHPVKFRPCKVSLTICYDKCLIRKPLWTLPSCVDSVPPTNDRAFKASRLAASSCLRRESPRSHDATQLRGKFHRRDDLRLFYTGSAGYALLSRCIGYVNAGSSAYLSIIIDNISLKLYSRAHWESDSGVCPESVDIAEVIPHHRS